MARRWRHRLELKRLRASLGVTRMDRIRNAYVRGTAQVELSGVTAPQPCWFLFAYSHCVDGGIMLTFF